MSDVTIPGTADWRDIHTIEDGDPPKALTFQPPLTDLTDRTVWLLENSMTIEVTTYSSQGNINYTVPSDTVRLDILAVGGGKAGSSGTAGGGGQGGQGGEVTQATLTGSLIPASITGRVGAGGSSPAAAGTASYVTISGATFLLACGGGTPGSLPSDTSITGSPTGAASGAGGAGIAGGPGKHSRFVAGGALGSVGNPGAAGLGYGGGGGGGCQSSGATSGGGGGGGGYGFTARASNGSGSVGGAGADGAIIFIAYRPGLTAP